MKYEMKVSAEIEQVYPTLAVLLQKLPVPMSWHAWLFAKLCLRIKYEWTMEPVE